MSPVDRSLSPADPDAPSVDPDPRLADTVVDWRFKGLSALGRTVAELRAARLNLFTDGFGTPLLTLDADALAHNLAVMARWTAEHGLAHAPHGKTPLAPQLMRRQLAHGAWGITAATATHLRMYRAFGIDRIFMANQLLDPAALRWLAAELDAHPPFRFVGYVDSVRGVNLMNRALHRESGHPARRVGAPSAPNGRLRPRSVDVVVELGAPGSRTGVRTGAQADAVADAVRDARWLRLVGTAGYEGTLVPVDPADDQRTQVRGWLSDLLDTVRRFDRAGRFAALAGDEQIVLSAGGSEHFDLVAEALAEPVGTLSRPVLPLLRAGAYLTHDHGHYARRSPLRDRDEAGRLRPALHLWSQVLSRPEPGLALLDAGKRDLPYDLGLPMPTLVRDPETGERREAHRLAVTKLSDQHAFLAVPEDDPVRVGDWVALGLSHPCTAFEKWQLIPEVRDDGTVVDYIRTFF